MAHGLGPLGRAPLHRQPFIPPRAFVPRTEPERHEPLDASNRAGTRDGYVVDAGRRIDAFAKAAELTEQQATEFDAASEGFLTAVAAIRSERLGSMQTAQHTQGAIEEFALRLDALELPERGQTGSALMALVGELQHAFDQAFEQPVDQDRAPQIFFPRLDARGVPAEKLFSAYHAGTSEGALPPDSSVDTVA